MKVFIVGKGGSGKSTVSALLAEEISRRNYSVLVVDNDESNYGLHSFLGLDMPEDLMYFFGGKENLFEESDKIPDSFKVESLPEEYISRNQDLGLVTIGKIKEYGEGCACPMNALSANFLNHVSLHENEFLLVDMDAGIEHFGREVERGADIILDIIDPTRESLKLSEKIARFVKGIDKEVYYILNRVDSKTKNTILEFLDESRVLGSVLSNEKIAEAGLKGDKLNLELEGIKKAVDIIAEIHNSIEKAHNRLS